MKEGILKYHVSDEPAEVMLTDILAELSAEGESGAQLYNKISNILYKDLGVMGAELVLVIWYVLRRLSDEL